VVAWSGTSAGWLGFDADEQLCAAVTRATGVPTCTSVLALNQILQLTSTRSIALVTPYRDDIQRLIARNYEQAASRSSPT
jgi:maleate isomerase